MGSGKGGSFLVHVGTNNVEREGTTAIVRKYRQLVSTLKQDRKEGSEIWKLLGNGN